jgi:hypothetical protein
MGLKTSWLHFTRPYVDRMMLDYQRNPEISLADWKEMQEDYKNTYGEYYERQDQKTSSSS